MGGALVIGYRISKRLPEVSVCNFQATKSLFSSLLLKFFVVSPCLMRDETEGLANEAYFSNPIASLQLSSLKTTNSYVRYRKKGEGVGKMGKIPECHILMVLCQKLWQSKLSNNLMGPF